MPETEQVAVKVFTKMADGTWFPAIHQQATIAKGTAFRIGDAVRERIVEIQTEAGIDPGVDAGQAPEEFVA